jgi:hypothetical protein
MLSCGIKPPASVFDDTSIKMGALLGTEKMYAAHVGLPMEHKGGLSDVHIFIKIGMTGPPGHRVGPI